MLRRAINLSVAFIIQPKSRLILIPWLWDCGRWSTHIFGKLFFYPSLIFLSCFLFFCSPYLSLFLPLSLSLSLLPHVSVIILAIVEVVIIILLIFLRKRILIAIALIKEASRWAPDMDPGACSFQRISHVLVIHDLMTHFLSPGPLVMWCPRWSTLW